MIERMSKKRIRNKITMILIMLIFSTVLMIVNGALMDQVICIFVLSLIFYAILSYLMEHERLGGRIASNKTTDFKRITMAVGITAVIGFVASFFPEFTKPIIFIPIVLIIFTSEWLSICIAFYYLVILSISNQLSGYELSAYVLLVLTCVMLLLTWEGSKKKNYVSLLFGIQFVIPTLFFYLYDKTAKLSVFLINLAIALLMTGLLYAFMDRFLYTREVEMEDILQDMLESEYHVVKELSQFSKQEYEHAKRVSDLAKRCASLAKADELVCAAAGFYYRIGILYGDEIGQNGYNFAMEKCFPEAVCNIIYEYQGMLRKPTTAESAIVQMVDGVCHKMELMKIQGNMKAWNQDMAIYQILNDFSAMGMYDQSGLSMNTFLKIRDYLVKEEFIS